MKKRILALLVVALILCTVPTVPVFAVDTAEEEEAGYPHCATCEEEVPATCPNCGGYASMWCAGVYSPPYSDYCSYTVGCYIVKSPAATVLMCYNCGYYNYTYTYHVCHSYHLSNYCKQPTTYCPF